MLLVIILTIVSVIKKFYVYVLLLYFLAVYDSLSCWSECMRGHVIIFLYSYILNVKHISYVTISI